MDTRPVEFKKLKEELHEAHDRINYLESDNESIVDLLNSSSLDEFKVVTGATVDVRDIYKTLLTKVKELDLVETCALFLVDDTSHEFNFKMSIPKITSSLCKEEMKHQIECGLFGWVIRQKKPVILPPLSANIRQMKGRTIVMVPLWSLNKIPGMLLAISRVSKHLITRRSLRLLSLIAEQYSLAIENCLLYEKISDLEENSKATKADLQRLGKEARRYSMVLKQTLKNGGKRREKPGERYGKIIEAAKDGIFQSDLTGKLVSANPAWVEMLGYNTEGEVISLNIEDLGVNPEDAVDFEDKLWKNGHVRDFHARVKKKNGDILNLEVSAHLRRHENGHILGVEGIVRNLTERKKIEDHLIQSEKLRALGIMASGVAHDFNNILGAILGRIQILLHKVDESPLKRELGFLEKISLDGTQIIRRIQEFTKTHPTEQYVLVHVPEIINDALAMTKTKWKDNPDGARIKIEVEEVSREILPIEGNPSELREVLVNIILNAIDAMPKGGKITIKSGTDKRFALISVNDSGEGIPKDHRDRVFEPFFTTKKGSGHGLGMSVAYGIITRHKGEITIDSEKKTGTTVTIKMPVSKKKEKKEKVPTSSRETKEGDRKAKILVIDDDENVRETLSDMLTMEGHEVHKASNGKEGIKVFKRGGYDLVFTDLGMPEMSGWDVAKSIKKTSPQTPVALVTGWGAQVDKESKDSKVDVIIPKPFQMNQILSLVSEAVELKDRPLTAGNTRV